MTAAPASLIAVYCDVRISFEARFVIVHQFSSFGFGKIAIFDPLGDLAAKTVVQQSSFIASATRRFTNGGAANHFLNQVTFFVDVNVSFVRRYEKVVAIAHDLLISADQHEREIVSLAGLE